MILLVMTDGRRDCIARTIPSALASLLGPFTHRIIHDDSGDPEYRAWLVSSFPTFDLVGPPSGRSGFGGAIASAWAYITERCPDQRWVFHLEDDFTFAREIDVPRMAQVLDRNPHIAQMALRRQPWNAAEHEAGGVVEVNPGAYHEVHYDGNVWLEHRLFFTTNPSLYSTELCQQGWPITDRSEGIFSASLFADPGVCCAYWGSRDSGEWVTHIGRERVGVGY